MRDWTTQKSTIAKMRVRGERVDALAARLQLARLLAETDLGVARAIVCLRRLSDPRPHTLALGRGDDRAAAANWRRAVAARVAQLAQGAFRPWREAVPAGAESVVFADEAELLACLADDWRRGALTENWWWRGLFPALGAAAGIAQIWLARVPSVPRAFDLLARRGAAAPFVELLADAEVAAIRRALIEAFALSKIERVICAPAPPAPGSPPSVRAAAKKRAARTPPAEAAGTVRRPPPPVDAAGGGERLDFARRSLLAVAVTLARAPQFARSDEFAARLAAEAVNSEKPEDESAGKPSSAPRNVRPRRQTATRGQSVRRPAARPQASLEKPVPPLAPRREKPLPSPRRLRFERAGNPPDASSPAPLPPAATAPPDRIAPVDESAPPAPPVAEKTPAPEIRPAQITPPADAFAAPAFFEPAADEVFEADETAFETSFGGVFYLLNLGLFLGLYRDFAAGGAGEELDLDIWAFVALLGRAFAGESLRADAVWPALLDLAGLADETDLRTPGEWRARADWLEAFPSGAPWRWSHAGGRLVVRHPAGFNVVDVPCERDAETLLAHEMESYGVAAADVRESAPVAAPGFRADLVEFAAARLKLALGARDEAEIGGLLLRRAARVELTPTHLTVTLRLAELSFAVRFAGLDRDPGWLPAAGRYVKFEYV